MVSWDIIILLLDFLFELSNRYWRKVELIWSGNVLWKLTRYVATSRRSSIRLASIGYVRNDNDAKVIMAKESKLETL